MCEKKEETKHLIIYDSGHNHMVLWLILLQLLYQLLLRVIKDLKHVNLIQQPVYEENLPLYLHVIHFLFFLNCVKSHIK